jgi:hypothetical protein
LRWGSAAALLVAFSPRSQAQVIPTPREIVMPPWNALQILEPTPLPLLSDPDTREDVAPEDTPVKGRVHPEYQPAGIRYGSWMFDPYVTAGGLYDSNVFSSNVNKQADIAAQVGAGLQAHTLWERHGIDLELKELSTVYRDHASLNENDVTFKAGGRYDIDHATQLLMAFEAAYLHEGVGTLTSPAGAVEPTPYSLISGDATLRRETGRITTSFGARIDSYEFGSPHAQDGVAIDQSSRDGQVYTGHGRFDYAISDKAAWFTSIEGNSRDLRGTPAQPISSEGYRALTGFDLELTHLITGEFAGGYMAQHFESATIGNVEGPAYRAMLTWSPSRQLDIHFNAEQMVTEAADTSATGVRADALQLGFDYEFRPNVILSSAGTYEKDHFFGEDRQDKVYYVDTQLKYLLNNVTSISVFHRYLLRDSSSPGFSFDKHQVGINATARF